MTYWYRAFGQLIRSDIEIPEYRPYSEGTPDITISLDDEPRMIRNVIERTKPQICGGHMTDDGVLLHFEDVGDFLIRNGNEITISPLPDTSMNVVRLFLAGSAMGVLFHQRGQYIFHGAAVLTPEGASVFVGESGAGKSTLAAHLAHAGLPVLSDDTLPLFEQDDGYVVWPGAEVFKMCKDALDGLGTGTEGLPFVGERYGKYFLGNPASAPDAPAKINEVFILKHGAAFDISPIDGLDAIAALNAHTYRREIIPLLGQEKRYLAQLGAICQKLSFYRFTRPNAASRLPEAVEVLKGHWGL